MQIKIFENTENQYKNKNNKNNWNLLENFLLLHSLHSFRILISIWNKINAKKFYEISLKTSQLLKFRKKISNFHALHERFF